MQFDNDRPIWLQLSEEFQRNIVRGDWSPGERIPSVRELALSLGVNPNTVQKALGTLDRLGLTVPERTLGRFTTRDQSVIDLSRQQLAAQMADTFTEQARGIGLSKREATDLVASRWNREEGGSDGSGRD